MQFAAAQLVAEPGLAIRAAHVAGFAANDTPGFVGANTQFEIIVVGR
jgi:hypothetical protein